MWARVLAVGPLRDPGFFVQRSADVPGAVCEGPIQREPTQQSVSCSLSVQSSSEEPGVSQVPAP